MRTLIAVFALVLTLLATTASATSTPTTYIRLQNGALGCESAGYTTIETLAECRTAATATGYNSNIVDDATDNGDTCTHAYCNYGCSYKSSFGKLWVNTNPAFKTSPCSPPVSMGGPLESGGTCVCAVPPPPTPTPTRTLTPALPTPVPPPTPAPTRMPEPPRPEYPFPTTESPTSESSTGAATSMSTTATSMSAGASTTATTTTATTAVITTAAAVTTTAVTSTTTAAASDSRSTASSAVSFFAENSASSVTATALGLVTVVLAMF